MASGTVKWFNTAKGFGFVQPDDGGSDVFIHISALNQAGLDSLDEGDKVDYELEQDRRSGKLAALAAVTGAGVVSAAWAGAASASASAAAAATVNAARSWAPARAK